MNSKYAIVILSHSSYRDLWPILIQSYSKYFDSKLFDFYISSDMTSEESLSDSRFKLIQYASDIKWSDSFFEVVDKLDYSKVVFTFDDLILTKYVDDKALFGLLESSDCNYLKLICSHVKIYDRIFRKSLYFEISKNDSYRGSLVFTALDKDILMGMKANTNLYGLSPWEYEREVNSNLSNRYTYCSVRKNIFRFDNMVLKGKVNYFSFLKLDVLYKLKYAGDRNFLSVNALSTYYLKLFVFTLVKYVTPSLLFSYIRIIKQKIVDLI